MGLSCCGCSDRSRNVQFLFNEGRRVQSREMLESLLIAISEKDGKYRKTAEDKRDMKITFPNIRSSHSYCDNPKGKLDYKKYRNSLRYEISGLVRGESHIYTIDAS
eukprot:TRINITY_DN1809_c0_g2_i2.p1 TRINITY_DN1809_c0_g2~~TRINITY_DN1809_c0_g2_i2.p1  ORF type:complete len:106 (+),score=19.93 TRINITY_DN1809_c0_g2_i2:165-482(+)